MKKGFTLIELLVVVLIIGILAAIALPQYTKAVEKSRTTEALLMTKNIADAIQRGFLQGTLPGNPLLSRRNVTDTLDIDLSGGVWDDGSIYTTPNFSYFADCSTSTTCNIAAYRNITKNERTESGRYLIDIVVSPDSMTKACYHYTSYPEGAAICKGLEAQGFTNKAVSSSPYGG
ncbi:type IV pilus assembly protein PilE [Elusimicrobium posterum]|uniref:type IV pilin protein n=1 Tax=Elusimicrobium posterum TaxID=3116653 RepID=UPI003C785CCA